MDKKRIFVSHARTADGEKADEIVAYLEAHGLKCFIAPRDIPGGKPYASELVSAIKEAEVVLLIGTPAVNESEHILNEIEIAINNKKTILHFVVQDYVPSDDLVYYISRKQKVIALDGDYKKFCRALHAVTTEMCRQLAADGEGATRLIECRVHGARSKKDARLAAKSVVNSNLVKAMIFGADANGGRVMCALGYAGAKLDPAKIDVDFRSAAGTLPAYRQGSAVPFSEDFAKQVLSEKEIVIDVMLHEGNYRATAWGCDLTYDYVKINGDYRT